jgi:hypothetical protein
MMIVDGANVSCPFCGWKPQEGDLWVCDECKTKWNTFQTHGKCPGCDKQFIDTQCKKSSGGCGQVSLNVEWYNSPESVKPQTKEKFTWFWKRKKTAPITDADRKWVENGLLTLAEVFGKEYFKSLPTIMPDKNYFEKEFDGTEADAAYILGRLTSIMQIDLSEIKLNFFSNPKPFYSGGLYTVNVHKSNSLANTAGLYVDNDVSTGPKEIWVDISLLRNPMFLTKVLAHELTHYKLLGERRRLIKNDERLTDLATVGLGLGIFVGNAPTYLQAPIVAYALAWLVRYRSQDASWKDYLQPSTKKYFENSLAYIDANPSSIKWSFL